MSYIVEEYHSYDVVSMTYLLQVWYHCYLNFEFPPFFITLSIYIFILDLEDLILGDSKNNFNNSPMGMIPVLFLNIHDKLENVNFLAL